MSYGLTAHTITKYDENNNEIWTKRIGGFVGDVSELLAQGRLVENSKRKKYLNSLPELKPDDLSPTSRLRTQLFGSMI